MTLRAHKPGGHHPHAKHSASKSPQRHKGDDGAARSLGARFFMFCLKWGIVAAIWGAILVMGVAAWYARELPTITKSATFVRKPSITILANNGSVVARYGDIKGDSLMVKDFPPHLIEAVLATEDRRFYYHFGLDPIGLVRAVVVNLTRKGVVQGGSTITQQLAKNLFLTQERTLKRKIQEALLALWLEHELSKDEILAAYLNRVYLGAGAYGMDAAAKVYFNKSVREVSLREAAQLAGLLKAPSRYSPRSNPLLSDTRADVVIANMKAAGYLEKDGQDSAKKTPLPRRKPIASESAQYYGDWITEQLDDLIGAQDQDITIETTYDPDIQRAAAENIARVLQEQGEDKKISQGAAIVMRRDGAVLALVGGRDYGASQFNRATHALRAPGSSFKPIVYLTALEQGYTPDTIVYDAPITEGDYKPANFDDKYYGEIPLRSALAFSLNTVAVGLMQQTGAAPVLNTARRLGITSYLEPNLSTALGSNGTTQMEMTAAYATLANGGLGVTPYGITKITTSDSTALYERVMTDPLPRVFSASTIADLRFMMQGVVEFGTGMAAKLPVPAAGKTGTSQDYRDAWFNGFTDSYIASIWVGNDDNSSMKRVTGGGAPANIWRSVMMAALADPTPAPDNVPAGDDGALAGLLSRVLSAPAIHSGITPQDNEDERGVFPPAPESPSSSGGFLWWGGDKKSPAPSGQERSHRLND